MRIFRESDEPRVLPIPYWTKGDPGRRFFNVKKDPRLVRGIAELRGCAGLRTFVIRANGARSRFATLGCDHWVKAPPGLGFPGLPVRRPKGVAPGSGFEAGLYVDLVLDRIELAARKANSLELIDLLRARARASGRASGARTRDPVVVRLQPQRVHFEGVEPDTAWMLSVWVFGEGPSPGVAKARRDRALREVAAVCAAMSREVTRRFGRGGTPVPP
jgi:hypothetical protein